MIMVKTYKPTMRRHRRWNLTELSVVLLLTAAAFAWGKQAALIERGYAACGGEYMLLLFPALYYAGKRTILDWIAELRALWRDKHHG